MTHSSDPAAADNADNTFEEARQLHERVDEALRDGQPEKAKRAFSRTWRDAVPELPFRFHCILQRPDSTAVLELRKRLRPGVAVPELKLRYVGGRRNPQTIEVTTVGRPRMRLGELPAKDVKFLRDIGTDADLYRATLMDISVTPELKLDFVAVELARDEVRFCEGCGLKHEASHLLCDDCRRRRGRRKTGADVDTQRVDATPIAFHEVVEAIAAEHTGVHDGDADLLA